MKRLIDKPNTNTTEFWNDYYDSVNVEYDRLIIYEQLDQILCKIEFDSVLEIGCGTGIGGSYLKNCYPGIHYTGSDFSIVALDKAQMFLDSVLLLDIRDNNPNDFYDVIIIAETLEHLEDPYDVIDRCLNYCTYLVLSLPLNESDNCDPEHLWCNINPTDFSDYNIIHTNINTNYFQIIIQ